MSLALLFVLPALPARPPSIHVDGSPAAAGPWLDRFNLWRTSTGVGGVVEDATYSAGDYNHAQYMVMNDLVTHYETAGTPYYTAAGDTAARNSNIYVSSSTGTADTQAIDWWMGAPFHAMGMMDPRLMTTGFGSFRASKSGWQMGAAVDVVRGNSFTGGTYPVFFPGNGTTEPLTSYSGNEYPDPLQACSGYTMPTGLPIFVEVGGNVATTAGPVHTIVGNGVSLPNCVIDSSNAALGSYLTPRGGVVMIPRSPLQTGVTYTVALTVNGVPYTWSFTVGAFATCNVTATESPASPAAPGTTVTVTASSTGCTNPVYQFWTLAPGSTTWQLAQAYSASASYTWNTSGLTGGSYLFSVWARSASTAGAFGNVLGRWDGYTSFSYALSQTACKSVTATASPSPAGAGTTVTVTGAASGCSSPRYEFWVLPAGSQTWQLAQAYSASASYAWSAAGKAPGTYNFSVWARDATSSGVAGNSLGTWDAYAMTSDVLASACTAVTATSVPAATAARGTAVTITAAAIGCSNPLYEFWILAPGSQTWQLAQAYSTSAALVWNTTGKAAGVYHFSIWTRDASSAGLAGNVLGRWDAYVVTQYSLT